MGILDSKPHSNTRVRITFAGTTGYANQNNETIPESFITKSVTDNFYIHRPIPATDHQYYWMSSSVLVDDRVLFPMGYATSSTGMMFVSSSEIALGIHTTTYWSNLLSNTASFTSSAYKIDGRTLQKETANDLDAAHSRMYFSRMGPYQFSSWEGSRVGEHPVAQYMKENNKIFIHDAPRTRQFRGVNNDVYISGEKRNINGVEYEEPLITIKYHPLIHKLSVATEQKGFYSPTILKYTHSNHTSYFANKEIDDKVGVQNDIYLPYDSFTKYYLINEPELETVGQFLSIEYTETVWPKESMTFLSGTRNRPNFDFNWKSTRELRTEFSQSNSQGANIPTASMWYLDARTGPYATAELFTTSSTNNGGHVGELMSVTSIFHNGTPARITASALFSRPELDSSSAGQFFTNDTESKFCPFASSYVFGA
jgi:hypothetical protein